MKPLIENNSNNLICVSIITVCYNSIEFIESCIKSVRSQDYLNIEYIVIDGGSTDGTVEIIKKNSDIVDIFSTEADEGIYDAINKGVARSSGEIIALLHSDDFFDGSDIISTVVREFTNNKGMDLLFGRVVQVQRNDRTIRLRKMSSFCFNTWQLRFGFCPPHPATYVRKSAYNKVGCYNKKFKIAGDFDWFVKFFNHPDLRYGKLKKNCVIMRAGGASQGNINTMLLICKEQRSSLLECNIYTNLFFLSIRLPIKFFAKIGYSTYKSFYRQYVSFTHSKR